VESPTVSDARGANATYTLRLAFGLLPNRERAPLYRHPGQRAVRRLPRFDVVHCRAVIFASRKPLMAPYNQWPHAIVPTTIARRPHRHPSPAAGSRAGVCHTPASRAQTTAHSTGRTRVQSVNAPLIVYVATVHHYHGAVQRGRDGRDRKTRQDLSALEGRSRRPKAVDRGFSRTVTTICSSSSATPRVVSAPLSHVLRPGLPATDVHRARDKVTGDASAWLTPRPTTPQTACVANAAAMTSCRRSSASSPICPGARAPGLSFRHVGSRTASRRRC